MIKELWQEDGSFLRQSETAEPESEADEEGMSGQTASSKLTKFLRVLHLTQSLQLHSLPRYNAEVVTAVCERTTTYLSLQNLSFPCICLH